MTHHHRHLFPSTIISYKPTSLRQKCLSHHTQAYFALTRQLRFHRHLVPITSDTDHSHLPGNIRSYSSTFFHLVLDYTSYELKSQAASITLPLLARPITPHHTTPHLTRTHQQMQSPRAPMSGPGPPSRSHPANCTASNARPRSVRCSAAHARPCAARPFHGRSCSGPRICRSRSSRNFCTCAS